MPEGKRAQNTACEPIVYGSLLILHSSIELKVDTKEKIFGKVSCSRVCLAGEESCEVLGCWGAAGVRCQVS